MGFSLFLLLVCPKGFTLPTSSDYSSLTTTYNITNNSTGSTKIRQSPLDFVYAGFYDYSDGSLGEEGSGGYYWSRTTYSGTHAYFLGFGSSRVSAQACGARGDGYALRCVGMEWRGVKLRAIIYLWHLQSKISTSRIGKNKLPHFLRI